MRKSIRFFVILSCFALLFSSLFMPIAAQNDKKFDSYINMGENFAKNNYEIPNLFRQNGVYSNVQSFPLVVQNGVEYVPLSMFILFPYVDVSYSKTSDDFFLVNTTNNHYISFNVDAGVASTYDGDLLTMNVEIFNRTRYVPARTVAIVLGFVCESFDDPSHGVYAFRISDGKTGKTLSDMIKPYIDEYLKKNESKTEPTVPTLPQKPKDPTGKNEDNENDEKPEDPLEKLAKRDVYLCYANMSYSDIQTVVDCVNYCGIKASFTFTEEEIYKNSSLVRELMLSGHTVLVTANGTGETAEEYAKSFIEGIERANDALKLVTKKKTRMCTFPFDIPSEIKNDEAFCKTIENAGYLVFTPNFETGDGAEYDGSAYAISGKIRNKISYGFKESEEGIVSTILYCSDKTYYYTLDLAHFVNKYAQFGYYSLNEAFLLFSKGV